MIEDHTPINGTENHTPINGTENRTPIKMMSATEFAVLNLEEKRNVLRAVENEVHVENQKNKKELFSFLSQDEKKIVKDDLKKSIAKMMVYWVAHSRHDLYKELVADNANGKWARLALREAFGTDEEWKKFFHIVFRVFTDQVETEVVTSSGERVRGKIEVVKEGAIRIGKRVHGGDGMTNSPVPLPADWESSLDPYCPGDGTLDAMYRAAVKFVDDSYPE